MLNEDIVARLRTHAEVMSPLDALRLIANYGGREMTQFRAIACLKAIFPELPLRAVIEASASKHIVGDSGLSDAEVGQLFKTHS